jgi:propane monooxygenase reductase subunit
MAEKHSVTVLPVDVTFECTEDEPVLTAALRNGLSLPYGCRKGNCGTCKAQVLAGEIDLEVPSGSIYGLSEFERSQGFTLLCSTYALDDVTVEMEALDAEELALHPRAELHSGTITAVEALTRDIRGLEVTVGDPIPFRAGQFAELCLGGTDTWRSYSMASPSWDPTCLRFMIKLIPGGAFSSRLATVERGQELLVRAPLGSFWIRDHDRPLLLIGGGAGMGPLWAMLLHLVETADERPVRFCYGARTSRDLFYVDEIEALGSKLADFVFVPALSDEVPSVGSLHRAGLISDVVERELRGDIGSFDAYLCGPPPMIDACLAVLESHGLKERRSIFYDKFTAS